MLFVPMSLSAGILMSQKSIGSPPPWETRPAGIFDDPRQMPPPKYATAEKGFGIESHLPVVLIVTGRESLGPFQEVTMRGRRSAWIITLDISTRTTLFVLLRT